MQAADTAGIVLLFGALFASGVIAGLGIALLVQARRERKGPPGPPGPSGPPGPTGSGTHPEAVGIFGALADCGLPAGSIMAYMRTPRSELGDYTPRQAVIAGDGERVVQLARQDADMLRLAQEEQTQDLGARG